jgi:hypothetical protein
VIHDAVLPQLRYSVVLEKIGQAGYDNAGNHPADYGEPDCPPEEAVVGYPSLALPQVDHWEEQVECVHHGMELDTRAVSLCEIAMIRLKEYDRNEDPTSDGPNHGAPLAICHASLELHRANQLERVHIGVGDPAVWRSISSAQPGCALRHDRLRRAGYMSARHTPREQKCVTTPVGSTVVRTVRAAEIRR